MEAQEGFNPQPHKWDHSLKLMVLKIVILASVSYQNNLISGKIVQKQLGILSQDQMFQLTFEPGPSVKMR